VTIRAIVATLGIATLAAYLDRLSWFFELGTFFRLQYAALLVICAGVALAVRQWVPAAGAVALALVNVGTIAPHWSPRPDGAPLGGDRVRMLFVNVDVSNRDHRRATAYVRALEPDIVGVTELSHAWARALVGVMRGYRYRIVHIEDDAYGIGLYSQRRLAGRIERLPADGPATVVARFRLARRPVTLVVTHPHTPFGPHAGGLHQQQLRALARARAAWQARAIVCGDLNTPPWSGPLRSLERRAHLADSHRGYGFESTWPTWLWLLRTPIDNCLLSKGLLVVERSRGPKLGSDHFPLVIELAATRLGRGG
jgi:endonuclease/exonuclease/phosphatase (EEP) superfamily protein YafD